MFVQLWREHCVEQNFFICNISTSLWISSSGKVKKRERTIGFKEKETIEMKRGKGNKMRGMRRRTY